MNEFAISPKPPSNVPGTDYAGTLFTFEWDINFPVTGNYIFRGAKDNEAKLYLDNQFISDLDGFRGAINPIKKYIPEGRHSIRIDLINTPIYEKKNVQLYEKQNAGVDFIKKPNGIFMTVGGNIETEVTLKLSYDDDPNSSGTAITEIRIPNPDGQDLVIKRPKDPNGSFTEKGSATGKATFAVSELGYGPIQFKGTRKTPELAERNLAYGLGSKKFGKIDFFDARGNDVNASLTILSSKNVQSQRPVKVDTSVEIIRKEIFNTIDYINKADRKLWRTFPSSGKDSGFIQQYGVTPFNPNNDEANTNSYAGTHVIRWSNVNFPKDGNYNIEIMVDDNVTLYIGNRTDGGNTNIGNGLRPVERGGDEVIIRKNGFTSGSKSTGKTLETKFFKAGNYRIRAELEQIKGKPIAKGNPMALAIKITSISGAVEVISPKSWNENPMGVALSIEAPEPVVPQEPPAIQEGRCPPNPIWSTRSSGASEQWYPVKFDSTRWSRFMNRYAISPVKPLQSEDTDGAGVVYTNTWNVDIPFDGFYGLKATVDNFGRILIDGKEILGVGKKGTTQSTRMSGFGEENPEAVKLFLTEGSHSIEVEVENQTIDSFMTIDEKIFNTADWATKAKIITDTSTDISINTTTKTIKTSAADSKLKAKFVQKGSQFYLEVGGTGTGEITLVMDVDDKVSFAGLAAKQVIIPSDSGKLEFIRKNSNLKTSLGFSIGDFTIPEYQTIKKTGKFTAGKTYGPIQINGAGVSARGPIINKPNRLGIRDADGDDENIKITIAEIKNSKGKETSVTIPVSIPITEIKKTLSLSGGIESGYTKDGIVYEGPTLSTYAKGSLGPFLTPAFTDDADYRANNMDKTWISTWSNVDFPEDGRYELKAEADDRVIVRVDGVEVGRAKVFEGVKKFSFNATKGKKTIELEYFNIPGNASSNFATNPVVFSVIITRKRDVKTGKGKPWSINPIGISAALISPPCPKRIDGRGIVTDIIVEEPGNGYLAPSPGTSGYPVTLKLKEVLVKNSGINYNCGVDQIEIIPSNGAQLDYECDTFGRISKVNIVNPGMGFTEYPIIRMVAPPGSSPTGINAEFTPVFEVVRDPVEAITGAIPQDKLIQVTDLVGLKQTGYVDGRAYYGAVFYKEGIRYAGYFETAGQLIQVYDTLQESITAQVTTAPSAIIRQGTDIRSNDPRLNIPGTPDTLI